MHSQDGVLFSVFLRTENQDWGQGNSPSKVECADAHNVWFGSYAVFRKA